MYCVSQSRRGIIAVKQTDESCLSALGDIFLVFRDDSISHFQIQL
jgi:hypothetical protein